MLKVSTAIDTHASHYDEVLAQPWNRLAHFFQLIVQKSS
jgi:hypothetical protein